MMMTMMTSVMLVQCVNSKLLFLFRLNTSELSRVGDVIGQVKAVDKDKDSQSNVFYRITGGNDKGVL